MNWLKRFFADEKKVVKEVEKAGTKGKVVKVNKVYRGHLLQPCTVYKIISDDGSVYRGGLLSHENPI